MINIQEQNIRKLTINGKWQEGPDGEKTQAESYAEKHGYEFSVHPVKGEKFQLVGTKVLL